ncbi:MAG: NADH-quinone oxidoreductase subunit L [Desulfurococcaceae archaeon]
MELALAVAVLANFVGAALVLAAGGPRRLAEGIAVASALAGTAASIALLGGGHERVVVAPFVSFVLDPLSRLFAFLANFIGLLTTIYSVDYMAGDEGYRRYYALFLTFIGSMTNLVLAGDVIYLFMHWELVGVCSALLISYWWERAEARRAGIKALVMTRASDVGLAVLVSVALAKGTTDIRQLADPAFLGPSMQIAAIAVVIAAMGKSAQFPFHTWLPDAMEGPTPVSALLHAATMVKAGVYLVARFSDVVRASWAATTTMLASSLIAALLASLAGTVAADFKRVLAYSTVSSLSLMLLALSLGEYVAAIAYLVSHAMFKSLLFLSAGDVEHSAHTRDMRTVHGVAKRGFFLEATAFLVGALNAAGLPPLLSGLAKEEALAGLTIAVGPLASTAIAAAIAFLTALFVVRAALILFFVGYPRSELEPHVGNAMKFSVAALLAATISLPLMAVLLPLPGLPQASVDPPLLAATVAGCLASLLLLDPEALKGARTALETSLGLDVAYTFIGRAFAEKASALASSLHRGKPSTLLFYFLAFLLAMILAVVIATW